MAPPLIQLKDIRLTFGGTPLLSGVELSVSAGERVCLIGRNGSGKSTLLKILSRITRPSKGQVEIYGRVGSLLEVGTGFHPELTGRENVYVNGIVLGLTRPEIDRRVQEAAETALDPVTKPAALVAVQPSTGELVAVVSTPFAEITYYTDRVRVAATSADFVAAIRLTLPAASGPSFRISWRTGRFVRIDRPRSPWTAFPMNRAYCT